MKLGHIASGFPLIVSGTFLFLCHYISGSPFFAAFGAPVPAQRQLVLAWLGFVRLGPARWKWQWQWRGR